MVGAQLFEEGDGGLGAAVAVELHRLDLARLHADRRIQRFSAQLIVSDQEGQVPGRDQLTRAPL